MRLFLVLVVLASGEELSCVIGAAQRGGSTPSRSADLRRSSHLNWTGTPGYLTYLVTKANVPSGSAVRTLCEV